MGFEPYLGARNDVIKLFGLWRALEFGLALHLPHPRHRREAVAVNGLADAFLLHKRKGMDDGKELADVVRTEHGTEMEHHGSRGKVYAAVFHLARIAAACRVNGPCGSTVSLR